MRRMLHCGAESFEILEGYSSIMKFRDPSSTLSFLRTFLHDPEQMRTLRNLVGKHSPDAHRMKDEEVVRQLALYLVRGDIKVIRKRTLRGGGIKEEVETPPKQESAPGAKSAAPKKNSWIEITLVGMEGQPVPGERYMITLPDGSTQEGRLDADGYAEYYGINPGSCQIWYPDLSEDYWKRF